MKSSKDIMQEATQLFAKLGQNVVIRKNLEKEAHELQETLTAMEMDYQAALKAEADAAAAAPSDPSAPAPADAPAPTADATGTP